MSAPSDVLRRTSRFTLPPPSTPPSDLLRALFRVGMREQAAQFAQHGDTLAALNATSAADSTSRERAMIALRMYSRAESDRGDRGRSCLYRGRHLRRALASRAGRGACRGTALRGLAERGDVKAQVVDAAIEQFGIDIEANA